MVRHKRNLVSEMDPIGSPRSTPCVHIGSRRAQLGPSTIDRTLTRPAADDDVDCHRLYPFRTRRLAKPAQTYEELVLF
jgi:hypothetical protein